VDPVRRDECPNRGQRADQLDVGRVKADLFLGFAESGEAKILVGFVLAAARERDLAGVSPQVGCGVW
jgi:hypothetical protein